MNFDSTRFPSTPARTPRNVRRGQWPHPQRLTRGERKAKGRAETKVVRSRATSEPLSGATTVRRPSAPAKKLGFLARVWKTLATKLW